MKLISFIAAIWTLFSPLEYPPVEDDRLPEDYRFKEKVIVFQQNHKARVGYLYWTTSFPYPNAALIIPPAYDDPLFIWDEGDLSDISEKYTLFMEWDESFEAEALKNYHRLK